jgi:hypothetical protein
MGDHIELMAIEVIQDGLIMIDLKNETTNQWERVFVSPDKFFGMLGKAMQSNYDAYIKKEMERYDDSTLE